MFCGRSTLKIGDQVRMNGRYAVAEKDQGRVFRVRSRPFFAGGESCVLLEGYDYRYPAAGLTVVAETKDGDYEGGKK